MRMLAIVASFVALALSACSSYEPPRLDPGSSLQRFESRRLDDAFLRELVGSHEGEGPLAWDLDSLTRAAIALSPDLEAARAKWRVAQAGVVTAGRHPNPSLDASAGRATNAPAGDPAGLADLALGIRIETAGKRERRIDQATALSESDRLELHAAAWQLRGRIRDAMLDWNAARREIALLDRKLATQRSIVRMLARRVELGEAAMDEKSRAEAARSRTELDRSAAAARASEARSRLAQAIGIPLSALDAARITFEGLHPRGAGPEALRGMVVERDDLRAALARYAAADAAYRLEIARQYPDLELGPSYSYDTGTNKISLGVMRISLPVADRNEGPILEARARRDQSAAQFEALQASLLAQFDRAGAAERQARSRSSRAQALLERERRQLARLSRRFSAGEADRLALASARAAAYDAERTALDAEVGMQKATALIEDSIQAPVFGTFDPTRGSLVEAGGSR